MRIEIVLPESVIVCFAKRWCCWLNVHRGINITEISGGIHCGLSIRNIVSQPECLGIEARFDSILYVLIRFGSFRTKTKNKFR